MKNLKKADIEGIDKIVSFISNNPTVNSEQILRKALELGYHPQDLIDKALGSVKYEKSSATLSKDLEDVLNDVYEKDLTPGDRYVIEPREARTAKGKLAAKDMENLLGLQYSSDLGKSRKSPDKILVRNQYGDLEKLLGITTAGHELRHSVDDLIRPGFESKTSKPFKKGHHYGDVYETSELVREIKNLPENEKIVNEIKKQSKKLNLKNPGPFRRLLSLLSPLAAASALKSGDVPAAVLNLSSTVDPTGISDAGLELKRRLEMTDPEEIKQTMKEDKYSAIPGGPSPSDIMLDDIEDYENESVDTNKNIETMKKKLGYK